VETVARTWRRTREATRADLKQSAALSSLATAAAARTPSIASFEAGARAKMKEDGACVERDTSKTKEEKTTRVMTSSSFGIGCFVVDDAPAPPGVAAALATRGGLVAANSSNVDDVDELETATASMGSVEKTNDGETNVAEPRFGSRLLASKRSVAKNNAETCAEAAARLRVTLTESEALLHTQRARAADALRREVTRAFGNENGDGDATRARVAVHGW
jgi:hypothetical protein